MNQDWLNTHPYAALILATLQSPAIVALIMSGAMAGLKWLHDAKNVDTDKWVSMVYHLYNAAESEGSIKNWSGEEKLSSALTDFKEHYLATFGEFPSDAQSVQVKNDLAKLAYHDRAPVLPVAK